MTIKLGFFAHHGEPAAVFKVPKSAFVNGPIMIEMSYCPFTRKWVRINVPGMTGEK